MASMSDSYKSLPRKRPNAIWLILWIGLLAGTLDITDNLIFNALRGITPRMVFQFIASGLIGRKAFGAGFASVVLGVILHYVIALTWTAHLLCGQPQAPHPHSPSRDFRLALRRCGLPVHELRRPAALGHSARAQRTHARESNQRSPRAPALYRANHLSACAQGRAGTSRTLRDLVGH
ncbi:MAG: hypothetical protein ACYDCD_15290 [Candidatus Acidiferrales bacterium]